ncbi:conserved hypothetical protein [Mucor ambiguus]|uniref:SEC7 domain-containing protein n=1 Tax=Mucor ambiguus TaxID=91626 RepID=A0A0C9MDX8_9FUNG|nr:conserved hypothetical protein [Mucor ambiguus]
MQSAASQSSNKIPCTYINMDKTSQLLKKLKPSSNTVAPIKSSSPKHIPITIPAKLTSAQKEAALPFLNEEPVKTKSSKAKALGRFFKKLTHKKDTIKSSTKKTQYKLTFIPIIKKKDTTEPVKAAATEIVWYDNDSTAPESVVEQEAAVMDGHKASPGNTVESSQQVAAASNASDSLSMSSSSVFKTDNSAVEYAQRIWDEDDTVYANLDHVVEWIGNGQSSSSAILKAYMTHFDFKALKLEQAFRNLCSKLHLKGETQQIDRILSEFAGRYFECNPNCIFGTTDVVHAIVYSLLLLNTDLHVAQGDYKKMSRSEFVKNTMEAIYAQLDAPELGDKEEENMLCDDHRASGLSFQSLDWIPLQRTPSNQSAFSSRSSAYAQSLDSSMPRNLSAWTFGSKSWQIEVKNLLKQMYSNIRHSQITNPSSPPASLHNSNNNRMSAAFKRSVGTIIWKRDSIVQNDESSSATPSIASIQSSSSVMQYQAVASHLQTQLPTAYTSNAPYYKEGMVVRKHLLEKTNQKAKHRDWKDCFMVIERSQLRMYKLDNSSVTEPRTITKRSLIRNTLLSKSSNLSDSASQLSDSSSAAEVVGGGDWMSNAQLMGAIDLKHTLANALPSGYSRQRQHAFALQQSNGAVYLFQVGSEEQVHEWVSTCNYWAARESKEPLAGGVSSMEYGWGHCLESQDNVFVHEWQAPVPPTMSSLLEESAQLATLRKHVQELSAELDQHRDIKPKMEARFASHKSSGVKAMTNWEDKSHYLLHEIIKYQNYCDSIEKSLALQSKIMSA